jgi:hypothetical protein
LRRKFLAYFSSRFSVGFSVKQRYLQQQVSAQVVYDFFLQHNKLSSFVSGAYGSIVDWRGPVTGWSAKQSG